MSDQFSQPQYQAPAPAYVITRVEDTFGPAGLGGQARYKRVWFKALGQPETYVDVALTDTVVQDAETAIMAHVNQLGGILNLKAPLI